MSDFFLLLVNVDQSRRSASASLLDRRPSMSAGIRAIGINRTSETSTDEMFRLMGVLHGCCPFAFLMMARA
jgi:hypothetical protein